MSAVNVTKKSKNILTLVTELNKYPHFYFKYENEVSKKLGKCLILLIEKIRTLFKKKTCLAFIVSTFVFSLKVITYFLNMQITIDTAIFNKINKIHKVITNLIFLLMENTSYYFRLKI